MAPLGVPALAVKRANKCTNANVNPSATTGLSAEGGVTSLTVVDDSAALAALGLTGNAYLAVTDVAGGAVLFPGTTGNLAPHTSTVMARGTGTARLRINAASTVGFASVASAYGLVVEPAVSPSAGNRPLRLELQANATVYFVLNTLQEGVDSAPIPQLTAAPGVVYG